MAEDEAATVKTLATYREVMTSLIKQHRGRVVDSPGDNVLAEFSSVVDAVQCAVAVQSEFQTRNAELAESRRMEFRIGINVGDVIDEENRIYGDGVNIAARLEALADPGGICVSKTAFDQIETKLPLGYEYLGEQPVKNIPKPVGAYRVLMQPRVTVAEKSESSKPANWRRKTIITGAIGIFVLICGLGFWQFYKWHIPKVEPASLEKMAFPLPEQPSIAVLPFVNMSDDPTKEYLADGVTEQIIASLSKAPRIFIISRTSTFAYKNKSVKVQQVAEELGVQYVLEGSVQKSGDKIRIIVQLIDALSGKHIWAQRYDRDYKDIFAIQDEITIEVLRGIGVNLVGGENYYSFKRFTNLDAYEKWMETLGHLYKGNLESNATTRRLAEEAMALEPDQPRIYNTLALTHVMDVWLGTSKSIENSLVRALELTQKSLDIDENNVGAYTIMCFAYATGRKLDKAVEAGRKAIELNPNSDPAHAWLALVLTWKGRPNEAIELLNKAIRLCPRPPGYYYTYLGIAYRATERYEDAIIAFKKALALNPEHFYTLVGITICYGITGQEEESRTTATKVLALNPKFTVKFLKKRWLYADKKLIERWNEVLRKAGIPEG